MGISAKYFFCGFFLRKGGSGNLGKIFLLRIFSAKWREWESRQNISSADFFCGKAGVGISAKYFFCGFFLRKGGSRNLGKIFLLRIISGKRREWESWQNISSADFFCEMAGLKKSYHCSRQIYVCRICTRIFYIKIWSGNTLLTLFLIAEDIVCRLTIYQHLLRQVHGVSHRQ